MSWITLSSKAYRAWRNFLAPHFYGDGFIVDIISHSAVRYREGSRSITFSTEPLQAKGKKGNWVLAVYVHRPFKWDEDAGSVLSDAAQEELILSRIELALKSKVGRYELVREAI